MSEKSVSLYIRAGVIGQATELEVLVEFPLIEDEDSTSRDKRFSGKVFNETLPMFQTLGALLEQQVQREQRS